MTFIRIIAEIVKPELYVFAAAHFAYFPVQNRVDFGHNQILVHHFQSELVGSAQNKHQIRMLSAILVKIRIVDSVINVNNQFRSRKILFSCKGENYFSAVVLKGNQGRICGFAVKRNVAQDGVFRNIIVIGSAPQQDAVSFAVGKNPVRNYFIAVFNRKLASVHIARHIKLNVQSIQLIGIKFENVVFARCQKNGIFFRPYTSVRVACNNFTSIRIYNFQTGAAFRNQNVCCRILT